MGRLFWCFSGNQNRVKWLSCLSLLDFGALQMPFGKHKWSVKNFVFISMNFFSLSLSATYTVLYSESDPSALAKYRLWKSVGFVVTYGVQKIIFVIASELFSSSPSSMPVTSQFDFHSFFYLFISPSAWYVTHLSKFICVGRTINKRNLLSVTHHDLLRFFHISLSLSRACACFK